MIFLVPFCLSWLLKKQEAPVSCQRCGCICGNFTHVFLCFDALHALYRPKTDMAPVTGRQTSKVCSGWTKSLPPTNVLPSMSSVFCFNWINVPLVLLIHGISKRVQRLKIDLRDITTYRAPKYTLRPSCLEIPNISFNMKFLTCLYFVNVNITGELLQYFICNCPLLEALSVMKSCHLVSLVVPGTALQLKCLEIFWCPLESFLISAPNLVSLKFSGHTAALRIGNMSKLVDVTLAGEKPEPPLDKLRMFSSYHHQLEFLKLTIKPLGLVCVKCVTCFPLYFCSVNFIVSSVE